MGMNLDQEDLDFIGAVLRKIQHRDASLMDVEYDEWDNRARLEVTCPGCGAHIEGVRFFNYAGDSIHRDGCRFIDLLRRLDRESDAEYLNQSDEAEQARIERQRNQEELDKKQALEKARQKSIRQEMGRAREAFLKEHNLRSDDLEAIVAYRCSQNSIPAMELGTRAWDPWEWEIAVQKWEEAGRPVVQAGEEDVGGVLGLGFVRATWP